LRNIIVKDPNEAASIKLFKHELEDGLATLKSLNAERYYNCPTIANDVIRKLPLKMIQSWGNFAESTLHKGPGTITLSDVVLRIDNYTSWQTKQLE
jgi:hypothetical protein